MAKGRDRGVLFVVSAPSGTGKSTLARRLLERVPSLEFSVSYTTRPRRPGERGGREYHYVDDARFESMLQAGELLEWANIYGRRYGTGRAETLRILGEGRDLLLDIDVQGARQIRESGVEMVGIFVLPPDFSTLAERLRSRASDDEAQVMRRLAEARNEAEEYVHYDYLIVNDDLERASGELAAVVLAERMRVKRRSADAKRILATFPEAADLITPGEDRDDQAS